MATRLHQNGFMAVVLLAYFIHFEKMSVDYIQLIPKSGVIDNIKHVCGNSYYSFRIQQSALWYVHVTLSRIEKGRIIF